MGEAWRCLIATDLDNCTYMLHNSGENRVYDPVASDPLQHATYGPYLALCLQSTPNPTISLRCCLFHDEEGPLILLQPPFLKYDPFIRLATAKGYVVGLTEDGIPYLWQDVDIRLGIYQTTSPKTVPSYFPPPSRLPKRAGLTQLVASVARYSGLDSLVLCALTTENRLMVYRRGLDEDWCCIRNVLGRRHSSRHRHHRVHPLHRVSAGRHSDSLKD
ncbi:hypothetical protein CC85DRAFT_94230 [Cutaneotrichosporon oleaginosum]|uniref:Uncharacterized protein n=1 Tax=Cutaneotrichosporon oleaginosum TaxID=879819 RepID=A0A0J0XM85_9TREE|nr:uncharacterized protein CC85DRAFT_94230 [Cutaneotrichosporon oleaginosum]KLT42240.1 hypothetical protein CC85DRAFT_94230 [Cutaneotrichosporon oleaginosum]TXT11413.1 hypothetical protein COLE_01823 [Cutaneotrichosporon oleaginosum]